MFDGTSLLAAWFCSASIAANAAFTGLFSLRRLYKQFWSLIDEARAGASSSARPEKLADVLAPLNDDEVSGFCEKYYEKICDLNQWRLWGAGFVIAGGMSDDSFHYFRSWIIGKGESVFDIAMKEPGELGSHVDDPEVDNELLEYVALTILDKRGIKGDPRDRSARRADEDPVGEPFDEDNVSGAFPKLTALFG
jgi:hypothetical protein